VGEHEVAVAVAVEHWCAVAACPWERRTRKHATNLGRKRASARASSSHALPHQILPRRTLFCSCTLNYPTSSSRARAADQRRPRHRHCRPPAVAVVLPKYRLPGPLLRLAHHRRLCSHPRPTAVNTPTTRPRLPRSSTTLPSTLHLDIATGSRSPPQPWITHTAPRERLLHTRTTTAWRPN
jgi:hypothetical protein